MLADVRPGLTGVPLCHPLQKHGEDTGEHMTTFELYAEPSKLHERAFELLDVSYRL